MLFNSAQFLLGFLPVVLLRLLPAAAPRPERISGAGELFFLCELGLALFAAFACHDLARLLDFAAPGSHGARRHAASQTQALRHHQRGRQPWPARILQVLQLLYRLGGRAVARLRARCSGAHIRDRPAGGDLVLHLPGTVLHHRCVSRSAPCVAVVLGFLPRRTVFPAPGGRADPARGVLVAAGRQSAPYPALAGARRHAPRRLGLFQEGLHCRQPCPDRQYGLQQRQPVGRRDPDRRARLHVPDLLRFFRLYRHRARNREDDGFRIRPEFQPALFRDQSLGLLAPLAHQPVELAARLPLQIAGRQPRRHAKDLPQLDADHAAGRPVARCSLEFRALGLLSRRHPRAAPHGRTGIGPRQPGLLGRALGLDDAMHRGHVLDDLLWLAVCFAPPRCIRSRT